MAKETLQKYMNRKLKSKGTTVSEEKKKAGKYKSIGAAQKAGSLYYTDKNGKVMAAVFAGDLNEEKSTAPETSPRPKIRKKKPGVDPSKTKPKSEIKPQPNAAKKPTPSSDRGKSRTVKRIRKPGGPDPSGIAGKKTYVSAIEKKSNAKGPDPDNLAGPGGRGTGLRKKKAPPSDKGKAGRLTSPKTRTYTFDEWSDMTLAQRRKRGLPAISLRRPKVFKVKR